VRKVVSLLTKVVRCLRCASELVHVRYLGVFSELLLPRRGEIMSMFAEDGTPLWGLLLIESLKVVSGSYESSI
jgi:hypothetical protein